MKVTINGIPQSAEIPTAISSPDARMAVQQANQFTPLQVVFPTNNGYALAKASSKATLGSIPVLAANNQMFWIPQFAGIQKVSNHNLGSANDKLYLSATTAGEIVLSPAQDFHVVVVGIVMDANHIYFPLSAIAV